MVKYDLCSCGARKQAASIVCKNCHNRRIAPLGYAAMARRWGEKWAVRHVRASNLAKPSIYERAVMDALDKLGVRYEREYWLQTKASGRKARVYLIDFVVRRPSDLKQVAIEIQGAWAHFRHGRRDLRRLRYLRRRGFPQLILTDSDVTGGNAAERADKTASLIKILSAFIGLDETCQP